MSKVKKQHYVPQFYLKRFSDNGKTIFVFDKESKVVRKANISDVAEQRFFYDFPKEIAENADIQMFEKVFAKAEQRFKEVLEQFIESPEREITLKQKHEISPHIAMQWMRTKEFRETIIEGYEKVGQANIELLMKINYPNISPDCYPKFSLKRERDFLYHEMFMSKRIHYAVINSFLNHIWTVGINETSRYIYTSDNPVVWRAHINDVFTGGMAPLSKGVQIMYPIDNKHVLILKERTFFKKDEDYENKFIKLTSEEIDNFNTLQVIQSYRQVFCLKNSFQLEKLNKISIEKRCRFDAETFQLSGKHYIVLKQKIENGTV
jgi:hypothetical protein